MFSFNFSPFKVLKPVKTLNKSIVRKFSQGLWVWILRALSVGSLSSEKCTDTMTFYQKNVNIKLSTIYLYRELSLWQVRKLNIFICRIISQDCFCIFKQGIPSVIKVVVTQFLRFFSDSTILLTSSPSNRLLS